MKSISTSLRSVLFWSIISAAFIGPGTVTTAARAGAGFGLSLVWALVFATFAAMVLQEAAARITLASGKNLGQLISRRFSGAKGLRVRMGLFLTVAFGCAAYQTGNMLGALAGIRMVLPTSGMFLVLLIGAIAAVTIWFGNIRTIAHALGLVVAAMGIAFIVVAIETELPVEATNQPVELDDFITSAPLLVLGLIGTTIVPYNLFLASGISSGQSIRVMRTGIFWAVFVGGIISIAILVVGTRVESAFSFEALGLALSDTLGTWAQIFFAFGLFAAGLSSSITAPLAAGVTGRSLLGDSSNEEWNHSGRSYRLVWITVLAVGVLFGMLNVQPIPAIILAQAVNGLLLPVVALFLLDVLNDPESIPANFRNGNLANLVLVGVVGVAVFLGLNNLGRSVIGAAGTGFVSDSFLVSGAVTGTVLIMAWRLIVFVSRDRAYRVSDRK